MDWNRVEGNWKQMKGKVKEQWGKLTDDDLDVINGKQEQLEGDCSNGTATPRIRRKRKWMNGTVAKNGDDGHCWLKSEGPLSLSSGPCSLLKRPE